MKKLLLQIVLLFCVLSLSAQWVPVESGLDGYPVNCLYAMGDNVLLGTAGGGLFYTIDNGSNWSNISGNIGNMHINTVNGLLDPGSGNYVIFVGTEDGAYYAGSDNNYIDSGTGLTNRDVNFFYADGFIGTNGGGYFVSETGGGYEGPWVADSDGIAPGDGLILNSMAGYSDDNVDYMVLATDGGVYWREEPSNTWVENSGDLTGDALKVKGITALSNFILIATENGSYYTLDAGNTWTSYIPDIRFNLLKGGMLPSAPSGMYFFMAGETTYHTWDLQTWSIIDLGEIPGEITAVCFTSTDCFIGVTNYTKDGEETGGAYRIPINEMESVFVSTNDDIRKEIVKLEQNYPNPFTSNTTINYQLDQSGFVSLKLMDIFGREIKTVVSDYKNAGDYSVQVNVDELNGNMFFYTLSFNNEAVATKRMIVIK